MSQYKFISSLEELNSEFEKDSKPKKVLMRPLWLHIYHKQGNKFILRNSQGVWEGTSTNMSIAAKDVHKFVEQGYGLTRQEVISSLLELFDGKDGYYAADLKLRRYFYCASEESLREKLIELGATEI